MTMKGMSSNKRSQELPFLRVRVITTFLLSEWCNNYVKRLKNKNDRDYFDVQTTRCVPELRMCQHARFAELDPIVVQSL